MFTCTLAMMAFKTIVIDTSTLAFVTLVVPLPLAPFVPKGFCVNWGGTPQEEEEC